MFICKLEGLDKPEGFINRASNRKIIDCYLPQDPLVINYEQTPKKIQTALKLNTAFQRLMRLKQVSMLLYTILAASCVT